AQRLQRRDGGGARLVRGIVTLGAVLLVDRPARGLRGGDLRACLRRGAGGEQEGRNHKAQALVHGGAPQVGPYICDGVRDGAVTIAGPVPLPPCGEGAGGGGRSIVERHQVAGALRGRGQSGASRCFRTPTPSPPPRKGEGEARTLTDQCTYDRDLIST